MFITVTIVCRAVSVVCWTRLAISRVSRGELFRVIPRAPGFYVSSAIVADSYNDTPCQFTHWRPLGAPLP
jgi:hypothetical protein